MYLDEIDDVHRSGWDQPQVTDDLAQMFERLGISPQLNSARSRIKRTFGCLANAVAYLHENDIRHKDLNPRNILLEDLDSGGREVRVSQKKTRFGRGRHLRFSVRMYAKSI